MATQVGHHTKQGERKIRFLVGVAYEGTDYGPDYDDDELSLNPADAHALVHSGRAVYTDEGPTEAVHEEESKAKADAGKSKK